MDHIDYAISVLNRLHMADPTVLQSLIFHRVPCNEAVAEDPTIQIGVRDDYYEVGLLGIINGLFGTNKYNVGHIAAHVDSAGLITRFYRIH